MSWPEWAREHPGIEPSLYAADFARLGEQLEALLDAGARIFHFDVGDGHFVPEVTIGPIVLRSIAGLVHERGGVLDCHLMVSEPERHFASVRAAGGDSVTFHLEAVADVARAAQAARAEGLGAGLAFNPATAVEVAAEAAGAVDLVLCMSIVPGYSGQAFMPEALDRIVALRELAPPGTLVQVDGGISGETVADAHAAGADLLVAGSAVFWDGTPADAYRRLVALAGGRT